MRAPVVVAERFRSDFLRLSVEVRRPAIGRMAVAKFFMRLEQLACPTSPLQSTQALADRTNALRAFAGASRATDSGPYAAAKRRTGAVAALRGRIRTPIGSLRRSFVDPFAGGTKE